MTIDEAKKQVRERGISTAEDILNFLKTVSEFHLGGKDVLHRTTNGQQYIQINGRFARKRDGVHYEIERLPRDGNSLDVALDDERTIGRSPDDLRNELVRLAREAHLEFGSDWEGKERRKRWQPPRIDCSADPQSVVSQIWKNLKTLYTVFEPTLIQFENQRNNNFTNAEPQNRSDSTKADMNTEIQTLLKSNLNVILTGAPGTGKTYTAKQVACAMTGDDPKAEVQPHIESVQFHPGYDYSDFVIGMKPVLLDEDGKEVKPEESRKGKLQVSFRWKDGIFKTFANKAKDDLGHNYVFLIDEINRADLSRVFGELFSLLEEEYRYPNNKKGVTLPNGDPFVIPRNLFIIGTMNDIDRSVESMDFALRRRFAWKEVRAKDTQKDIFDAKKPDGSAKIDPVVAEKLKKAMDALNFEIAGEEVDGKKPTLDLRLGPEYELGGSIFAKFEKCGDFNDLWKNHIEIILNEYLRGRKEKNALLKSLNGLFFESVGMAATQTAEGTGEP